MDDVVSLADLGAESDPGTAWHPRENKVEVRDDQGDLCDLTDEQVEEHFWHRDVEYPDNHRSMAAEDSQLSPKGAV